MELNKAKEIMHKLLTNPQSKSEEYLKPYTDGILDFFNEATKIENTRILPQGVMGGQR